jgi:periplasmic divalent cation tolerance protein
MNKYSVILSTFSNKKEAGKVAAILLKNKSAACVNILSSIDSMYWWRGKIEKSEEVLAVIKTRKSLVGKVMTSIRKNHSYSVPEIIELPILSGNKDYLDWIMDATKS